MHYKHFTEADKKVYDEDSYVIRKNFFSAEEVNLIYHTSMHNNSDRSEGPLISACNLVSNKPYKNETVCCYMPIAKVPYSTLPEAGMKGISHDTDFLFKEVDEKLKKTIC